MEISCGISTHSLACICVCVCVCVCARPFPVSLDNCETQMKRILSLGCAFVKYPNQSKRHKNFTLNLLHCRQLQHKLASILALSLTLSLSLFSTFTRARLQVRLPAVAEVAWPLVCFSCILALSFCCLCLRLLTSIS